MVQTSQTIPARPLSERELQVLEMKADGLTYGVIGEILHIRERSAMQYAVHARDKLQAGTMVEAIVAAVKLGLFGDEIGTSN